MGDIDQLMSKSEAPLAPTELGVAEKPLLHTSNTGSQRSLHVNPMNGTLNETGLAWEGRARGGDSQDKTAIRLATINDGVNTGADGSYQVSGVETQADTNIGEVEEQNNYLHGGKLVTLTLTLMLGQFLTGIDATIITTAIPKITADFHSLNDVGWYGSAYLLTTLALQPTFGKVYSYFDIKLTFIASVLIFELGSIICAISSSSRTFIVGRAVAGVGQAAMLSGGMTVIGYRVPLERRAIYFAITTSMNAVASVLGPPLGGIFTDSSRLTWRFCFWINVPLGVIVFVTGWVTFQSPARPSSSLTLKEKLVKMDLMGAALFITGMVCLFLVLQRGGTQYKWSDSRVWGWLLGFVLTMSLFVGLQFRLGDNATIPPRIVSHRTIAACCLFTCFMSLGLSTHTYYLPFYFQSAKGVSAESSGLRMIPYLASMTVISFVVGGLMMVVGYGVPFMWFSSIVFTIASGLLSALQVNSSAGTLAGYQILAGTGFGSTVQVAAVAIQAALPARDLPTGNALILFSHFMGGALAVNIAQNIFSNTLARQLARAVPPIDVVAILSSGATAISSGVPPAMLATVQEAYKYAITRAFILPIAGAGVAFFCTFGVEWRDLRRRKQSSTDDRA